MANKLLKAYVTGDFDGATALLRNRRSPSGKTRFTKGHTTTTTTGAASASTNGSLSLSRSCCGGFGAGRDRPPPVAQYDPVSVSTSIDGWNPLHLACVWGHLPTVRSMINEYRFSPHCRDKKGLTPLHLACRWSRLDVVKYLLSNGCNSRCLDYRGNTPLMLTNNRIIEDLLIGHIAEKMEKYPEAQEEEDETRMRSTTLLDSRLKAVEEENKKLKENLATSMAATINNNELWEGVEMIADTHYLIWGRESQTLDCREYGLRIHIPEGALPPDQSMCLVKVQVSLAGQFEFPKGSQVVSAVYWIRAFAEFTCPVMIEMHNCCVNTSGSGSRFSFVTLDQGPCQHEAKEKPQDYKFRCIEGGAFMTQSCYGNIHLQHLSPLALVCKSLSEKPISRNYVARFFYIQKSGPPSVSAPSSPAKNDPHHPHQTVNLSPSKQSHQGTVSPSHTSSAASRTQPLPRSEKASSLTRSYKNPSASSSDNTVVEWEVHLVITWNSLAYIKWIEGLYRERSAQIGPTSRVVFEADAISPMLVVAEPLPPPAVPPALARAHAHGTRGDHVNVGMEALSSSSSSASSSSREIEKVQREVVQNGWTVSTLGETTITREKVDARQMSNLPPPACVWKATRTATWTPTSSNSSLKLRVKMEGAEQPFDHINMMIACT